MIEIIVTVSIIAVLVVLAAGTIPSIQRSWKNSQCLTNMRQLGTGISLYVGEHDGYFPPAGAWDTVTIPYLRDASGLSAQAILKCPMDIRPLIVSKTTGEYARSYSITAITDDKGVAGADMESRNLASLASPMNTILLMEWILPKNFQYRGDYSFLQDIPGASHNDLMHVCFADGHVQAMRRAEVVSLWH